MGRSSAKKAWLIPGVRPGAYATMKIRDEEWRKIPTRVLHPERSRYQLQRSGLVQLVLPN
jgi:hypothetical protein